ncbi:ribonuclease H1 [Drosophila innubila]|uniref:ribonuclease H1 n=1 Tax=Drosophila innubila TaxID=198719 RepID=UPI00148C1439|nr:ribonuclease H1 [Drosophila innubila]
MFSLLRSQFRCDVLKRIERTMAFYAVAKGRKVGIYANWAQCEEQVKGFKGAVYKKFNNRLEAEQFISPTKATGVHGKYTPDEFAVPLGQRQPPPVSWAPQQQQIKQSTDYWPEDVAEEGAVTEDDLMTAMYEVEGLPEPSTSRKRKTDADITENSKSKLPRHGNGQEEESVKQIGAFEFTVDSEGFVIVYTDGSCLGNGRKNACAGFGVYFGDDHPLNAGKPVLGRVTNNVGEIQASIYAIKFALDLGIEKLCIKTDSQFLINSITKWVPGWKSRGWRLKNMEPVKNVADFKELDELLQNDQLKVKWSYVEAHKGIKGNEMADKLAKQGSQLYREINSGKQ